MIFEWRIGPSSFWEVFGLGLVLVVVSVYKFGPWSLVLFAPLSLLLAWLRTRIGEIQQIDLDEVTAWWWLPSHVIVCRGFRRTTIRRWEVSPHDYAKLRRELSNTNRL